MSAFYFFIFVVPETGENASDAIGRARELSSTSVREVSARRSNDAGGVLSPVEVPNTVVKPIRRKYLAGNGLGG